MIKIKAENVMCLIVSFVGSVSECCSVCNVYVAWCSKCVVVRVVIKYVILFSGAQRVSVSSSSPLWNVYVLLFFIFFYKGWWPNGRYTLTHSHPDWLWMIRSIHRYHPVNVIRRYYHHYGLWYFMKSEVYTSE